MLRDPTVRTENSFGNIYGIMESVNQQGLLSLKCLILTHVFIYFFPGGSYLRNKVYWPINISKFFKCYIKRHVFEISIICCHFTNCLLYLKLLCISDEDLVTIFGHYPQCVGFEICYCDHT